MSSILLILIDQLQNYDADHRQLQINPPAHILIKSNPKAGICFKTSFYCQFAIQLHFNYRNITLNFSM